MLADYGRQEALSRCRYLFVWRLRASIIATGDFIIMPQKQNSIFDKFSILFGSKQPLTSAELSGMLDAALADVDEKNRQLVELIKALPDAILGGNETRIAANLAIETVRREIADVEMGIGAIERRLTDATAVETEAARKGAYEKALTARREAASRFVKSYPGFAANLVELIRAVAEADALIDAANADLPTGAASLVSTEHVARIGGHAEAKILKRETRDLWCQLGSTVPLAAEFQSRIEVEPGTGRGFIKQESVARTAADPARAIQGSTQFVSAVTYFEKRRFVVTEALDSFPGTMPEPLSTIALPGLKGGDAAFWVPVAAWGDAAAILRAAEARRADHAEARPTPERRTTVTYQIVEDEIKEAAE